MCLVKRGLVTWALKEWIASEQNRVVHVSCDAGFSDLGVESDVFGTMAYNCLFLQ